MDLTTIPTFSRSFPPFTGVSSTASVSTTTSRTSATSSRVPPSSTLVKSTSSAASQAKPTSNPPTPTPSPSTSSEPITQHSTSSHSPAKIAGSVIGASAAIAFLLGLLYLLHRKKRETQRRAATLPPSYNEEGIEASLAEKFQSGSPRSPLRNSIASVLPSYHEKAERVAGASAADNEVRVEEDPVPHLDGTPVRPTLEMATNPLGSIAELSATRSNVWGRCGEGGAEEDEGELDSPTLGRGVVEMGGMEGKDRKRDHVMSWSKYDAAGVARDAAARLSSPPAVPDSSVAVWSNMNAKPKEEGGEGVKDREDSGAKEMEEQSQEGAKDENENNGEEENPTKKVERREEKKTDS
ncbi:hypothetical protein BU16DRAFT_558764 [Lophium mytilinum]|uniref:Uncharacterized protein n=1 Tax=Lophium mytilinum TaxID=390894 RepID=A0A6A6R1Y5_9PEZI|nr:hypothetical protein BU16DRAFT_558764 [Lophium mytilinum]